MTLLPAHGIELEDLDESNLPTAIEKVTTLFEHSILLRHGTGTVDKGCFLVSGTCKPTAK